MVFARALSNWARASCTSVIGARPTSRRLEAKSNCFLSAVSAASAAASVSSCTSTSKYAAEVRVISVSLADSSWKSLAWLNAFWLLSVVNLERS